METRGAAMGFAAAGAFVAFLLSMPVVRGQPPVSYSVDFCASRGSTARMHCIINSARVRKTFWFTEEVNKEPSDLMDDSDYKDRAKSYCPTPGRCSLRITDVKESDSKTYRCRFSVEPAGEEWTGEPGTTLTVTALQVDVIGVSRNLSHISAKLNCSSSCGGPFYVWFINGRAVPRHRGSFTTHLRPEDSVSCGINEVNDHRSPSLYAPKGPSVSVSPSEVVEGGSVTLNCSSDANPAANYTWWKMKTHLFVREGPQLVFSSIQSSDSGEYCCEAENQLGKKRSEFICIDVKYAPRRPSVSVSPSDQIQEGSSVTLTCSSDANPAASYTWYKENQTLLQGPEGVYHFTSTSSEDSGTYYCKSENPHGAMMSPSPSLDVQYAPRRPSVSVSPSDEVVEGGSVTLTCSSDANPAASYTWYKEHEDSPKASGHIFTITAFGAEHSGNYSCAAHNTRGRSNSTFNLAVAAGFPEGWIAAVPACTAIVIIFILIFVFLWQRKKRAVKPAPQPVKRPDEASQKEAAEENGCNYVSVQFCKKQADPLDVNATPSPARRHAGETRIEYATVVFRSENKLPGCIARDTGEDPAALYNTVHKTSGEH